jgi:hypothetical protein
MHGGDHVYVTAYLTAWSRVLEKPIVLELVKIIPAFYGIRKSIKI